MENARQREEVEADQNTPRARKTASERSIWLVQRIHLAGQVESGSDSVILRGTRAPAPADAEASEKGALITSEVCLRCAGGAPLMRNTY